MADLYEITVEAGQYPVTLSECKAYMKITSTAEDDLIADMIIAATNAIELYTGQYFVTRTVQGDFDSVFCTNFERYPFISFRRAPLNTITSVQVLSDSSYTDEDYQLKKRNHGFTRILFDDFDSSVLDDVPFPVRIITTVGYTSTGSITAFADNGSGGTTVTSAAHGLSNGKIVSISGTTSYNSTYTITGVTTDTFDISETFVADDATGTWISGVPMDIKYAIMGYINFMHKNRNDCIDAGACAQVIKMSGFPAGVISAINRYRIIEVFA